jgi:hypothetical protein
MGYADQFDDADILTALSWMDYSEPTRIMKLACIFLDNERDIRQWHRNWEGPTLSNLKPFIKSFYQAPRGRGKATVEMVLRAIAYQRKCRADRKANKPYVAPEHPGPERNRRNAVASANYSIIYKNYDNEDTLKDPNCVGIGAVRGVLLMVDQGRGYSNDRAYARVYMRHKATGRVKVVVMENGRQPTDVVSALMLLAPENCLRSVFAGERLDLDFDGEGFQWQGKLMPYRGVQRIYRGRAKAHKTRARPKHETK